MIRILLCCFVVMTASGCATLGQGTLEEQQNAVKQREVLEVIDSILSIPVLGAIH